MSLLSRFTPFHTCRIGPRRSPGIVILRVDTPVFPAGAKLRKSERSDDSVEVQTSLLTIQRQISLARLVTLRPQDPLLPGRPNPLRQIPRFQGIGIAGKAQYRKLGIFTSYGFSSVSVTFPDVLHWIGANCPARHRRSLVNHHLFVALEFAPFPAKEPISRAKPGEGQQRLPAP